MSDSEATSQFTQHKIPLPVRDLEGVTHPQGADLTEKQEGYFQNVLDHFSKPDYVLPEVEKGDLADEEKYWLAEAKDLHGVFEKSYECLLRYLRATKWASPEAAIKRLEATLRWRREFGFYTTVTPEYVEPEAVTGKCIIFGYDVDGRPALYLVPSRQNTTENIRQIHFTIWMLEKTVELMGPGVETLSLMINFADRAKNPSLSTARAVLDILQTHYPEHLGKAIIINIPFLINAFFKIITPFVDPITRPKMKFNPQVVQDGLFTSDQVWKEFGGDCEFIYEHEVYWPALLKLAGEKKQARMERWRKLGAKPGVKEWDLRVPLDEKAEVDGDIASGEEVEEDVVGEKTASVRVAEVEQSQEEPNEKVQIDTTTSGLAPIIEVTAC